MKKNLLFAALCASGLFVASCTDNNPDRPDNPSKPSLELTLDVSSVTDDCAVVDIKASDESTAWYAGCILKSEYTDDASIVTSDMQEFEQLAIEQGKNVNEILEQVLHSGNADIKLSGLDQESEYYAYAYSLNQNGKFGKVYKESFVTAPDIYNNILIGDYFMNDGTIVSGVETLTEEQKGNCIGIVAYLGDEFWKEDPYLQREYPECNHGIVLALNEVLAAQWCINLNNAIGRWVENEWNDRIKDYYLGNTALQGFGNTYAIQAFFKATKANMPFFNNFNDFAKNVPVPDNTSGWYIPSLKEIVYLVSGEITNTANDVINDSDKFETDFVKTMNTYIEKAGGTVMPETSTYFSSTECAASMEWAFRLSTGKPVYILKYDSYPARALLAF